MEAFNAIARNAKYGANDAKFNQINYIFLRNNIPCSIHTKYSIACRDLW